MANNIAFQGNKLLLPNTTVTFKHDIVSMYIYDDKVIVLIDEPPESPNYRNIAAVSLDGKPIWAVQSVTEAFPEIKSQSHFVGMYRLENGNISAANFFGVVFEISEKNGKILGRQDGR